MRVKRPVAGLSGFIFLLLLAACSTNNNATSSSGTTAVATSGITTRAFVSNAESGALQIVNFANDTLPQKNGTSVTISTGGTPGAMWVSPDANHSKTVVFDSSTFSVHVITNSTEQVAGSIQLCKTCSGDTIAPNGIVVSSDGSTAWAAVSNVLESNNGQSIPGAVLQLSLGTTSSAPAIENTIPIARARHLALSNDGKTLLAFSEEGTATVDPTCSAADACAWAISTATPTNPPKVVTGFDEPVAAYFSSDSTTAFVLNCSLNCDTSQTGQPTVAAWTVGASTSGTTVNVNAAEVALLSGTTLFVAGFRKNDNTAWLTPVDATGNSPKLFNNETPLNLLSGGSPGKIALNGTTLVVGSTQCVSGCLAVVNVSSPPIPSLIKTPDPTIGAVTGLASIPNRSVVYAVAQPFASPNGELFSVNSTTGAASTIDIVGNAVDVVVVDP